jgi:RNA polymerase sigma-70 factor (ECF subfamily)
VLAVKFFTEQTMRCAPVLIPSAKSVGGGTGSTSRCALPLHGPWPNRRERTNEGNARLASRTELSDFLVDIERRAYKQALYAVRDQEAALDIVQDSMMKLSEKYGGKPCAEFPMLFQRILQNTIRDYYRRQKVRSLWTTLLSSLNPRGDEDQDPLETLQAEGNSKFDDPPERAERKQIVEIIEKAMQKLPARQREAFLLRYWEELDVAETAAAMGCSQGSVKTHCSRAAHALAAALRAKGIEP